MCGNLIIQLANLYYKYCKKRNFLNEQFFLDWQDKLNEISVR